MDQPAMARRMGPVPFKMDMRIMKKSEILLIAGVLLGLGAAGCSASNALTNLVPGAGASASLDNLAIPFKSHARSGDRRLTPLQGALGELGSPPTTTRSAYIRPGLHSQCIYLSDGYLGIVYIYDGISLKQIGQLTSPSTYGWAVAATQTNIYVGTFLDTIDEYKPCSGKKAIKTLKGAGYGYPYGIAIAQDGTAYANEWPDNIIDVWTTSGKHLFKRDLNESASYFLAVDAQGNLYSAGWNTGSTAGVVDRCDKGLKNCVTVLGNISFPGGIAFDEHQDLYVNSQGNYYSTISEFSGCANAQPKCHLITSFTYTGATFTAIALDTHDKNLYGAAILPPCFPSTYTNCGSAIGFLLPLSKQKVSGQTPSVDPAQPFGIAYWKPSPY
jgi:hypothetical protein